MLLIVVVEGLSKMSGVIKRPAIEAVISVTQVPDTKALKATAVISCLRDGSRELIAAIMIPMDDGFANPHKANVAIAELRG